MYNIDFHKRKREVYNNYASEIEPYKEQLKSIKGSINKIKKKAEDELMAEFASHLYKGAIFKGIDDGQGGGCIEFTVTDVFNDGVRLKSEFSERNYKFTDIIWQFDWFAFQD